MDDFMKHLTEKSAEASAGVGAPKGASQARITLYKNGFQVGGDDGEFFDISVPQNAAAIDEMMQGHVPAIVEAKLKATLPANARDVGIDFQDKKQETYVPPKPKFSFASSSGMSLAGASAGVGGAAIAAFAGVWKSGVSVLFLL
jgi:hypothetical protein